MHGFVQFERGSVGMVMELLEDGRAVTVLVDGSSPEKREKVRLLEKRRFHLPSHQGGVVLDGLGRRMGDAGGGVGVGLDWGLGLSERGSASSCFGTGYRLWDGFHPLVEGSSNVLRGVAREDEFEIASGMLEQVLGEGKERKAVVVGIGHSADRWVQEWGGNAQVIVVSASERSPLGQKVVSPIVGMTIAHSLRSQAHPTLLLVDSLHSHRVAVRTALGASGRHAKGVATWHPELLDACGVDRRSGGSVSGVFLGGGRGGEVGGGGEGGEEEEGEEGLNSLAERVWRVGKRGRVEKGLEEMVRGKVGRWQGHVLWKYATATQQLAVELAMVESALQRALHLGVEPESDMDETLGLLLRLRMLAVGASQDQITKTSMFASRLDALAKLAVQFDTLTSPPTLLQPQAPIPSPKHPPLRLLTSLFAITHGYALRVPLPKLAEFESKLFNVLNAAPPPPQAPDAHSLLHAFSQLDSIDLPPNSIDQVVKFGRAKGTTIPAPSSIPSIQENVHFLTAHLADRYQNAKK